MRTAFLVLALALATTGVTLVAPTADAMQVCVDNSPAVVQDCSYYLACAGQYCVDYPCRYCMPF